MFLSCTLLYQTRVRLLCTFRYSELEAAHFIVSVCTPFTTPETNGNTLGKVSG